MKIKLYDKNRSLDLSNLGLTSFYYIFNTKEEIICIKEGLKNNGFKDVKNHFNSSEYYIYINLQDKEFLTSQYLEQLPFYNVIPQYFYDIEKNLFVQNINILENPFQPKLQNMCFKANMKNYEFLSLKNLWDAVSTANGKLYSHYKWLKIDQPHDFHGRVLAYNKENPPKNYIPYNIEYISNDLVEITPIKIDFEEVLTPIIQKMKNNGLSKNEILNIINKLV